MRSIYWFRNDLRISDNPLLLKAIEDSSSLLPIFIFDPTWLEPTEFDSIPRFGAKKTRFWLDSVLSLKQNLKERGSNLLILFENPISVIPRLMEEYQIAKVYTQDLPGTYEKNDVDQLRSKGINIETRWQHTLLSLNQLPFEVNQLPKVFTQFRTLVEKNAWSIRIEKAPIGFPPLPERFADDDEAVQRILSFSDSEKSIFEAGEKGAQDRINKWIWKENRLASYKETRNGMLGTEFSSHFSPWLATGAISPRTIYLEVQKFQEERVKNESTYWLIFELLWRDFFQFSLLKHGSLYFQKSGLLQLQKESFFDAELFSHWQKGTTGIPLIDANMRQLNATGFMSNRGRQIVASFLINNLRIDWRYGAFYFENRLIDYDVASNWGNWAYLAGVGNDPRVRYFNILKQAKNHDPEGEYVKYWVPEVRSLQGDEVHAPWEAEVYKSGCYIQIIDLESTYPR